MLPTGRYIHTYVILVGSHWLIVISDHEGEHTILYRYTILPVALLPKISNTKQALGIFKQSIATSRHWLHVPAQ